MDNRLTNIEKTWDSLDLSFRQRDIKEYESYKDVPFSENIFWLEAPDLIGDLIERGTLQMEDMEQANIHWRDFLFYLSKEWPPERIKKFVIDRKRAQYARAMKHIQDLELKNRDARIAGVGFKERQEKYTNKIRIGERVLEEYKREGLALKTEEFSVEGLVHPTDMGYIQKEGFEKYLYFTLLFGCPI